MPGRTQTRDQNRAARIAAERARNRNDRRSHHTEFVASPPADNDADPPPF